MTKEKAYYQAFLILEHLPKEEYDLIPKDMIAEIEDKMEYDENISIDTSISLEKQKIDEKTYEILDKVIKTVEKTNKQSLNSIVLNNKQPDNSKEVKKYIERCNTENELYNAKIEMIRLNEIVEKLKNENGKVGEAKELIIGYRNVIGTKDEEISKLNAQLEKLKENNQELFDTLNKIPKFLRKMFVKDDVKLLKD